MEDEATILERLVNLINDAEGVVSNEVLHILHSAEIELALGLPDEDLYFDQNGDQI